VIHAHAAHVPNAVLAKGHEMLKPEVDAVVLDLAPEEHDTIMRSFCRSRAKKGVRNALSVVEKMDNPHVEDDFHRFWLST